MDIFKITLTVLLLCGWVFRAEAISASQKDEVIAKAFSDSYTHENDGKYDLAIKSLKAVYLDDSYEINVRLGWLHYKNGLFSESMTYYKKSIQLMPYAIEPKFGLTLPAAALGQWPVVEEQYNQIIEIDPKNTSANYRLGLIYYNKKDYRYAEKKFSLVVNLYPFDYDANIMLAWTSYFLSKPREAKLVFQKCLWMRPDDPSALEGLSLIK
jgi:tetratricopeptide (TPR) repeat protein